ncbi:MAG: RNA polymerase sigma factor [Gemmatimonadaceae bacterium]
MTRRETCRSLNDLELIDAMRRKDAWAWAEFFERFRRLLTRHAAHIRIPSEHWDVCIEEVLTAAAAHYSTPGVTPPSSMKQFLLLRCRRRYFNVKRARERRERHYAAATGAREGSEEQVVPSVASEYYLRASRGQDAEYSSSLALERLSKTLVEGLTDDEQRILAWLGEQVPYRDIAAWLGMSYGALAVKIHRLRKRLCDVAFDHADRFEPEDQREILRFLRRAHVGRAGAGATLPISNPFESSDKNAAGPARGPGQS